MIKETEKQRPIIPQTRPAVAFPEAEPFDLDTTFKMIAVIANAMENEQAAI